jgi:ABC-type dipeptide/oligopeptide/nickel transport system permease component
MRLVGIASIVFVLALTFVMSGFGPAATAQQLAGQSRDDRERTGQAIFRYDTFGDEPLWTDVLRMHEVIATVDPLTR